MSEMVERLALALCRARNEAPDGQITTFWQSGPVTHTYLEKARHDAIAVLRELRKPTEAMTRALARNFADESERHLKIGVGVESWHVMIDAALGEPSPQEELPL